jgi:hypothetical protein
LVLASLLGLTAAGLRAAAPTLDHLFPVAVPVGSTGVVQVIGKFEPWPPQMWVDAPGITFRPSTNSGRFTVEVLPTAGVGPHFVRLHNEEGASGPRFLVVTRAPQRDEQEPNDDFRAPQRMENCPVSINGRLEKGSDVDSYAVWLEAGQTAVAEVDAYVLASPLDAVLRVVDDQGRQLALNHDDGRTLDPFLAFTPPTAGLYVIQVFGFPYPATSDVRFAGNASCVYRLHLFKGPYARHTLPLGVVRGQKSQLTLVGWNLQKRGADGATNASTHPLPFDGTTLASEQNQAMWQPDRIENTLVLPVGDGSERLELEPNDVAAHLPSAPGLDVPGAVTGCINQPGDVDRYRFAAKKGENLACQLQAASLGFPLDAWLRVEDDHGKELKKAEGGNGADPSLEWAAPTNGTFVLAVGNLLHRGGPDYFYRLSVQPPRPAVRATIAANAFSVEAGKTNEVKFNVKLLHGVKGRFVASMQGLPDGVQAGPADVPEKGGDVTLKLVAAADAKKFSGPLQIVLKETETGREERIRSELVTSGVDNGVPNGFGRLLLESIDDLWLTVLPAKVTNVATNANVK